MQTSPTRALEGKAFAGEFWNWQHRFFQDAFLQYGNPSFFIALNSYEWDFWVEKALKIVGNCLQSVGQWKPSTLTMFWSNFVKGISAINWFGMCSILLYMMVTVGTVLVDR